MDISNASTGMVGRPFQVAALPALMDQDFIVSDPCIRLAIGMVEGRPIYAHRCILMCRCKGFGQLDEVLNVFFRDDLFFLFLLSLHR